jgi:hypothetical protein
VLLSLNDNSYFIEVESQIHEQLLRNVDNIGFFIVVFFRKELDVKEYLYATYARYISHLKYLC